MLATTIELALDDRSVMAIGELTLGRIYARWMIAAVGENGTKSRQLAESMRGLLLSFTVNGIGEKG